LARRILDLKKVKLVAHYSNDEIVVTASPFCIQQLVFHCLQEFRDSSGEAPEISVSVLREDLLAVIAVSGPEITFAQPATRGTAVVRDECRDGRSTVRIEVPLLRQAGG